MLDFQSELFFKKEKSSASDTPIVKARGACLDSKAPQLQPPSLPLAGCLPGIKHGGKRCPHLLEHNEVPTAVKLSPRETPRENIDVPANVQAGEARAPAPWGPKKVQGASPERQESNHGPRHPCLSQDTLHPQRTDFKPLKHLRAWAEALPSLPPFLTFRSFLR